MHEEDIKLFRTVCFIALLQRGEGLTSKAPSYIREKKKAAEDPIGAWNMLGGNIQLLVCEWARLWKFPLDACLIEISREEAKE